MRFAARITALSVLAAMPLVTSAVPAQAATPITVQVHWPNSLKAGAAPMGAYATAQYTRPTSDRTALDGTAFFGIYRLAMAGETLPNGTKAKSSCTKRATKSPIVVVSDRYISKVGGAYPLYVDDATMAAKPKTAPDSRDINKLRAATAGAPKGCYQVLVVFKPNASSAYARVTATKTFSLI